MNFGNKKIVVQVIIFVATFSVAFFVTKVVLGKMNSQNGELVETAEQLDKKCPLMIDSETRLDSVKSVDGNFNYFYTLVNVDKMDNMEDSKAFLTKNAQTNLDTASTMKIYRENNVNLGYFYKNRRGQKLFEFTIKPKK